MFDSLSQTPLIDFKGSNFHLIHINLDNSENSTKESNISGENSKCLDDTIDEQKYIINGNIFDKWLSNENSLCLILFKFNLNLDVNKVFLSSSDKFFNSCFIK